MTVSRNLRTTFNLQAVALGCLLLCCGCRKVEIRGRERLQATWEGYKRNFIVEGRVVRPKNRRDTVSEGQAYAMLRAVWMDDKVAFDECYRWTEEHLSRQEKRGDHLLAWRYGLGPDGRARVLDWCAASDADLDYALALLLASKRWPGGSPPDIPDYRQKALNVAADILDKEVSKLQDGELVLSPWPCDEVQLREPGMLVNPSYFSPAHYRAFYRETGIDDWKKLIDDTYDQVDRLLQRLGNHKGAGLVPDWCLVDSEGKFWPSKERGTACSWDAFRLWWRLALDWRAYGEKRARRLTEKYLVPFLRREMRANNGSVYVEYDYSGEVIKPYTSPAVIGVYAWVVEGLDQAMCNFLKDNLDNYFLAEGGVAFYGNQVDYYVNSWAWYGDTIGHKLTFALKR